MMRPGVEPMPGLLASHVIRLEWKMDGAGCTEERLPEGRLLVADIRKRQTESGRMYGNCSRYYVCDS